MSIRGDVRDILARNPQVRSLTQKERLDFLASRPELRKASRLTLKRAMYHAFHGMDASPEKKILPSWEFHSEREVYTITTKTEIFQDVSTLEVQSWITWYTSKGSRLPCSQVAKETYKKFSRALTERQMAAILAALGVRKDSPPVLPHVLASGMDTDDIVESLRESQEAAIELRLLSSAEADWKKRYIALKKQHLEVESLGRRIASSIIPTARILPSIPFDSTLDPYSPVLFLTDWHVGQKFSTPVGSYNKEVFRDRLHKLAQECDEWLRAYRRPLDHLHIALGGDMVDGVLPMRPQHNLDQDLHEGEQIEEASQSLAWLIEGLYRRCGAPCTVWSVGGNHDRAGGDRGNDPNRIISQWLTQVTRARLPREVDWFHSTDLVASWRVYDTLVLLTHGDRVPSDPKKLAGPYRQAGIKHYLVLSGHKHSIKVQQDLDVSWVQGPSLVGYDPYGSDHFGAGSWPAQCLIEIRKDGPRPAQNIPL